MKTETQSERHWAAAAERYAAAEPSDPFLRDRIAAHIKNGIAGYLGNGVDANYSATEGQEARTYEYNGETVTYQAVVYSNRRRP